MQVPIYEIAMYDIINIIRKANKSYYFYEKDEGSDLFEKHCACVRDEVFQFTDNLKGFFPNITQDTYCMVVCGAIMQMYLSELDKFDSDYFQTLSCDMADTKTKEYFEHIYYAIDAITHKNSFDHERDIEDWPNDLFFSFSKDSSASLYWKQDLEKEILEAIKIKPEYSYAYCLLTTPYLNSLTGLHFDFDDADNNKRDLEIAFIQAHRRIGDDLYGFLFSGSFLFDSLTYLSAENIIENSTETKDNINEQAYFNEDIADYAKAKGYTAESIDQVKIRNGYFDIEGLQYPAGIPFFKHYDESLLREFASKAFRFISKDKKSQNEIYDNHSILTEQEDYVIVYNHYALFKGLCLNMPVFDYYPRINDPKGGLRLLAKQELISDLLDVSAAQLERLEVTNNELKNTVEELKAVNELNQRLLMGLSHSASNCLNSKKLSKTGIELSVAQINDPTLDQLHYDGELLIIQAENEMYLRRQLDRLAFECNASITDMRNAIRQGLVSEGELTIINPIEYALQMVLSRIVTREDEDGRSESIRKKFHKSIEEWETIRHSFLMEVKEKGSQASNIIEWCGKYLTEVSLITTETWDKVRIHKSHKGFFDLVVEIVSEQLLNAFSHGNVEAGITITLGEDEGIEVFGVKKHIFVYIQCVNYTGNEFTYNDGTKRGIIALDGRLNLINGHKKGIDSSIDSNGCYSCTAWIDEELITPLKGGQL